MHRATRGPAQACRNNSGKYQAPDALKSLAPPNDQERAGIVDVIAGLLPAFAANSICQAFAVLDLASRRDPYSTCLAGGQGNNSTLPAGSSINSRAACRTRSVIA
nr:hypothetical protein [Chromobacterium haemolyticum]